MYTIRIVPEDGKKGRVFQGHVLASIEADYLWKGGHSNFVRPIWAMIAATEGQSTALIANLRVGRRADMYNQYNRVDGVLEFMKSAYYEGFTQRTPAGIVTTLFLPEMMTMDLGMVDPEGIRFALAPDKAWYETQAPYTEDQLEEDQAYLDRYTDSRNDSRYRYAEVSCFTKVYHPRALASLIVVYLERRTRCPILQDPLFHIQLCEALGQEGCLKTTPLVQRYNSGPKTHDTEKVGIPNVVTLNIKHADFEAILAAEVVRFYKLVK